MRQLTTGKYRGLQQCATGRGALAVLALDHRNNLRRALNPESPDRVTTDQMSKFKIEVTAALASSASAILLDPEVGAFQAVASGVVPGRTGLVVALEATGYTGAPTVRASQILPGWSVEKAKRMGASALKLLVYYHPQSPNAAMIEALVADVSAACEQYDIALMLEPLSYSLEQGQKKLSGDDKREVVIETARRLTAIGGDVLKAEFPLDIKAETDESTWAEACKELTAASSVPWILLSASVSYELYLRQVVIACQQGASGVAVGRAVWQEAPQLTAMERTAFLQGKATIRMQRLTALVDALATPWVGRFAPPQVHAESYRQYNLSRESHE